MCSPETDMHPYFNTDRFKHGDTPSRVDEEKEQSVCLLFSSISVSECLLLCRTQHASYIQTPFKSVSKMPGLCGYWNYCFGRNNRDSLWSIDGSSNPSWSLWRTCWPGRKAPRKTAQYVDCVWNRRDRGKDRVNMRGSKRAVMPTMRAERKLKLQGQLQCHFKATLRFWP